MRVALVCTDPGVPVFGCKGASVHVQGVARALRARGEEVHLVVARTGGPAPRGLQDVPVHRLPVVDGRDPAAREVALRRSDAAVADVLRAIGPVDLVYERYALWGRTATAWARRHGVPSVLEVNAPLVEEQSAHRVLVDRAGAVAVAASALGCADVVACVSDEVAAWAVQAGGRPGAVHVVPNGVDVDAVVPGTRPVVTPGQRPFVLGFVGTLKPWHGVDTLVEALAGLHAGDAGAYRLLLVGDGPQAASLDRLAGDLGVAQIVQRTGAVAPPDVPALLHRMDVAAAPYPDLPGFYFSPLKVYEYLAAGLPVVASAVGQVPQALEHGRLGVLVPPGDPAALTAAVQGLRADLARREALRVAARRAAVDRHSWAGVVGTVLDLVGRTAGRAA